MNQTATSSDRTTGEIMRLVNEGYRVLADLHDALGRSLSEPGESQRHVTVATRELAAIQESFDRRATAR